MPENWSHFLEGGREASKNLRNSLTLTGNFNWNWTELVLIFTCRASHYLPVSVCLPACSPFCPKILSHLISWEVFLRKSTTNMPRQLFILWQRQLAYNWMKCKLHNKDYTTKMKQQRLHNKGRTTRSAQQGLHKKIAQQRLPIKNCTTMIASKRCLGPCAGTIFCLLFCIWKAMNTSHVFHVFFMIF